MNNGGAESDKLKVRHYDAEGNRGVHARKDIKKDDVLLVVPLEQMITLEIAQESPIGKLM
jgi:hypothetical protein